MAEHLRRTQILLEPEDYERLADLARREGRSLSEVVREIVHDALGPREERRSPEERQHLLAQLEEVRRHREALLAERGGAILEIDVADLIRDGREERDREILAAIEPPRS
jgi:predicted CopG family antitoxin